MLGSAVKSMTNSRKLLTMLNNYGSTVSYTIADNTLCTNVAFDNYDRFVDQW